VNTAILLIFLCEKNPQLELELVGINRRSKDILRKKLIV
jgi:hypothetical protein